MAAYAGLAPSLPGSIAALSVDPPEQSRAMRTELGLPFPLLCDSERRVVQDFGLFNAKEKGGIAFPATFVLDADRRVRFYLREGTRARADPEAVAALVRGGPEPVARRFLPRPRDLAGAVRSLLRRRMRSAWPRAGGGK